VPRWRASVSSSMRLRVCDRTALPGLHWFFIVINHTEDTYISMLNMRLRVCDRTALPGLHVSTDETTMLNTRCHQTG
jgi:hypothetical protein